MPSINHDDVRRVRSFNRSVTQRIGALDDSFLGRGRPLGAARLLFEIGREGADVRDLRARLGLDSGYLSRLLRGLERHGLVEAGPAPGDRRVRRVTLTAAGLSEFAALDSLADDFAHSVLSPLGDGHRRRLVAAMAEVERLMRAAAVRVDAEPADSDDARACVAAYFNELAGRVEGGFDPARTIPADAADLTPPAGAFVVARLDGRPVGCGGLKGKADGIGEIKRMWVDPEVRGLGVGRRILESLEQRARALGIGLLRLETNGGLVEAQALYHRCGFREIAPFNDEPYADHWFEKTIG